MATRNQPGRAGGKAGTSKAGTSKAKVPSPRTGPANAGTAKAGSTTTKAGTAKPGAAGSPAVKAGPATAGPEGADGLAGLPAGRRRSGAVGWLLSLPSLAIGWPRSQPFQAATWILSLAGLGVSIYLTIAHYSSPAILACGDKGVINCAKVTTSAWSQVWIFPVAVLGLAFYLFMVAINSPWGWRMRLPAVYWTRLGSVVVGICFVLYLIWAEVIRIGNICLWCTSVHVVTFALFAMLVFHASGRKDREAAMGRLSR